MKKKILLISLIILFVILLEHVFSSMLAFENLETASYDLRTKFATDKGLFRKNFKHADKKIVIVAIDDYSKKELKEKANLDYGTWPWPRSVWSGVTDFIESGEPKSIIFNMVFSDLDSNISNDTIFSQSINRYDNIILGTSLENPKVISGKNQKAVSDNEFIPTVTPLNVQISDKNLDNAITYYTHSPVHNLYSRHNIMAVANKSVDGDNSIRKVQPIFKLVQNGKSYYMPSLSFAGFLQSVGADGKIIIKKGKIRYKGLEIPINAQGQTYIGWHGSGGDYTYVPISKILLSESNNKYVNPEFFKDKIVIIGRTAAGKDIKTRSINSTYADPEINATALDNFINDSNPNNKRARKFISKMPKFEEGILIILVCALVACLGWVSKTAVIGVLNSLVLILLYVIFCFWMFANPASRIWIPLVVPIYYIAMTTVIIFAFKFQRELAKKLKLTSIFGKLVSPKVMATMLKSKNKLVLKSSRKKITVLMCDVKNFTALSETTNPEKLLTNLNELFNEIVNIVLKNNGTIDKFIGDCVMAYWGDPIASEDDSYMAVKTALEIKKRVNELKILNAKENKIILDVKIGINTGEAILGLSGSEKAMSYTAIGDAVNVAARLESACSDLNRDILIAKSTYEKAKDKIVVLDAGKIEIKGKTQQVDVYEPLGLVEASDADANNTDSNVI